MQKTNMEKQIWNVDRFFWHLFIKRTSFKLGRSIIPSLKASPLLEEVKHHNSLACRGKTILNIWTNEHNTFIQLSCCDKGVLLYQSHHGLHTWLWSHIHVSEGIEPWWLHRHTIIFIANPQPIDLFETFKTCLQGKNDSQGVNQWTQHLHPAKVVASRGYYSVKFTHNRVFMSLKDLNLGECLDTPLSSSLTSEPLVFLIHLKPLWKMSKWWTSLYQKTEQNSMQHLAQP